MLSKLGEDPATRVLSPEEAAQAFMVEELEQGAPVIHQNYDPPTEKAIEAALTDAELFVSYNVPAKAVPPLEAVLPMAPRDVAVNQRLAALYARAARYADAARACQVLSDVYREAGHNTEAERYLEAARNYARRAPGSPSVAPAPPPAEKPVRLTGAPALRAPGLPPSIPAAGQPAVEFEIPAEQATPSVQDFSFDVPDHLFTEAESAAPTHTDTQPIPPPEMSVQAPEIAAEPIVRAETAAPAAPAEHEIDVSSEWENMLSVESTGPPPATQPIPEMQVVATHEDQPAPAAGAETEAVGVSGPASAERVAEKIQEIHFYISREMWESAKGAILDLTEIAPDAAEVTELIAAVSAGQSRAAAAAAAASAPKPVAAKPPTATPRPARAARAVEPTPQVEETPEAEELHIEVESEPAAAKKPARDFSRERSTAAPPKSQAPAVQAKPAPAPAASEVAAKAPLGDILEEPAAIKAPPAATLASRERAPAPLAKSPLEDMLDAAKPPAAKEKSTEDVLNDFVLDLEKTELADFVPRAKPEPVPAAVSAPGASRAAAPPPEARLNGDMRDAESASVLSDILSELQEETAAPVGTEEDPETHYNLGIAFKEMGLLDEAIGELQKVCHSMDRGSSFSQPIQAYTWLAQCLVDKGAPEAAVRWYKRALQLPRLDDGSRCAIYYDLALAFEASGDKKSALANFMEVYGSNIDFRDVASRIKALKS
jgi:tetratricopeptide (TPR) repeat protein